MLLNVGIVSTVSLKEVPEYGTYWRMNISGIDYDLYGSTIGFMTTARKEAYLPRVVTLERTYSDCIPNLRYILRDLFEACDTDRAGGDLLEGYMGPTGCSIGKVRLLSVIDYFKNRVTIGSKSLLDHLEYIYSQNYFYDEVTSIEQGEAPTFDVALPETHSFWSNGFISHNTWLATQAMISAQKMGGIAVFCDHEHSFNLTLAKSLGLDDSPGRWLFKSPRTYEESVALFINATKLIRQSKLPASAPICWVFDSLASMIPASVLEKEVTEQTMRDSLALAAATSNTFKVLAMIASETNTLCIFLNQMRQKPGVIYGDPNTTPGGNAPKFYASVRIQLGSSRVLQEVKDAAGKVEKEMIGSDISARCIKNKVNRPYLKCNWRFAFAIDGSGYFDLAKSLVDFAVSKGVLTKSGKHIEWTDGKKYFEKKLVEKITSENLVEQLEKMIVDHNPELEIQTVGADEQ